MLKPFQYYQGFSNWYKNVKVVQPKSKLRTTLLYEIGDCSLKSIDAYFSVLKCRNYDKF